MQREIAVRLSDIPLDAGSPVECADCGQTHGADLWHWPWCFRCRAQVRTCSNVRPRQPWPNKALCSKHSRPKDIHMQMEIHMLAAAGGAR